MFAENYFLMSGWSLEPFRKTNPSVNLMPVEPGVKYRTKSLNIPEIKPKSLSRSCEQLAPELKNEQRKTVVV